MNTQTTEYTENQQQAEAQLSGLQEIARLLAIDYEDRSDHDDAELDALTEEEKEGALSIEVERTVKIVLCTGGPHCEIRWPENGRPSIVCYGWFGADRFERELTGDEEQALEYAYGDWDTLAGIES